MGGPQCRLSILMNGNVPCRYFITFPVDFRIALCCLSILRNGNVPCRFVFLMSPVEFKKRPCRPVEFKGQGPHLGGPRIWILPSHFCCGGIDRRPALIFVRRRRGAVPYMHAIMCDSAFITLRKWAAWSIAVWEFLGRNTSGSSLHSANRKNTLRYWSCWVVKIRNTSEAVLGPQYIPWPSYWPRPYGNWSV